MVTNSFERETSCSKWEARHALMNSPAFFLFEGWREREVIFWIFSLLPMCSHHIPKHVPNSTWILSHMVCPKFNSHLYKLKRWSLKEHMIFYFATWGTKVILLEHAQCSQKQLPDGTINQYGSFNIKIKKLCVHPWTLISMNIFHIQNYLWLPKPYQ
jgi:hypothetical protein